MWLHSFVSCYCRLERLEHLAQKFKHKCDTHEEWAVGKEDMLKSQDFKRYKLNELKVLFLKTYYFILIETAFKIPVVLSLQHGVLETRNR
jgi:hypothetical protein